MRELPAYRTGRHPIPLKTFNFNWMKNRRCLNVIATFLSIVFLMATSRTTYAAKQTDDITNKGFFIGAQASTNGLGFNLNYMVGKRLTMKTGIESLKINYPFLMEENDISYDTELNFKTGGVFLLADFFYTKSLYFTGGAVLNKFNPTLSGMAVSDMQYGDIYIPAEKVGTFNFSFTPDLKISPYGGIGFRKFFGNRKLVSYNFETGLYYIGPPKLTIEATGLLKPTADPTHGQIQQLENQFSAYKYYPVVKFSIAMRLF